MYDQPKSSYKFTGNLISSDFSMDIFWYNPSTVLGCHLNANLKFVPWSKTSWEPLALYHSQYLRKKRRGKYCYVYHFWHGNDVLPVLFPALTTFCMVPCCNLSFDRSHFLSPQPALDDWLVITEGRCCIWCVMCYSNLYVSVDRFQDNQWVVIRTS